MTTLTAARLTSQQLGGPLARRPEDVVTRLLAVQGQDPRGARRAVWAALRDDARDVLRFLGRPQTPLVVVPASD